MGQRQRSHGCWGVTVMLGSVRPRISAMPLIHDPAAGTNERSLLLLCRRYCRWLTGWLLLLLQGGCEGHFCWGVTVMLGSVRPRISATPLVNGFSKSPWRCDAARPCVCVYNFPYMATTSGSDTPHAGLAQVSHYQSIRHGSSVHGFPLTSVCASSRRVRVQRQTPT